MSIINILFIIQGLQSLVLAGFLVFTRRGKKASNIYLAGFLLTLVVEIVYALVSEYTLISLEFLAFFGFLYGPFLFLYIQSLNYVHKSEKSKYKIHLVPIGCFTIGLFTGISSSIFEGLLAVCFAYYFFLSFFKYLDTKKILKSNYSNLDIVDIEWLFTFLVPFFPLIVIDFAEYLFDFIPTDMISLILVNIQALIILFIINYLTIAGWMKTNSFMGIYENIERTPLNGGVVSKSYKDNFDKEEIIGYAELILEKIDGGQLFKNPEMNIQTLAKEVDLSPRQVSHTINLFFKTNFSDFINQRRLKYAKNLLVSFSNDEKNVSQIIYESGFNSTTSFYTYFKKNERTSPKEFRQTHRKV